MAQIAATALGVEISCVKVLTGDTDKVPYGGGTWASRAAGIGGEAAVQAGLPPEKKKFRVGGGVPKKTGGRAASCEWKGGEKRHRPGPPGAHLSAICAYR